MSVGPHPAGCFFVHRGRPFLAQSGHAAGRLPCPLLGVKRTPRVMLAGLLLTQSGRRVESPALGELKLGQSVHSGG
jgi:hypothetical protein